MSRLRSLWQRLCTVTARQWGFAAATVVVLFLGLMGIIYAWDYTNSPSFCGTTCHTMPPEYNAWQRSPHARVTCVECHIGRDIITTTFTRKAGDLMHVVRYSSGQFTFPLHAESMIPARESCERCHWPEKFTDDSAVIVKRYDDDAANSLIATFLLIKTGGGTHREGRGLGIHWHVENKVDFIATDELKQNIPWIQVTDNAGRQTVYVDVENPLPADEIKRMDKTRMDCIDCHNRISHNFRSPDHAMDQALELKRVDADLPSIKSKAVELLSAPYKSFAEADQAFEGLDVYYRERHPEYYRDHAASVRTAIDYLKSLYQSLVFPSQDLTWNTHPDNIGHKEWPGCFRCHDGKHFTPDNTQAVRLECNICHSLPEVRTPGGPAPVISMVRGEEPESHRATTWLAQHRTIFDATCQQCHDTNNAGGNDNSSFCSNSACHGTEWRYAGLNALGLAKIFPPPVPPRSNPNVPPSQIPHPIGGSPDCQICHAQASRVRPYPADHVGRTNDVCLACHKPTLAPTAATPGAGTTSSGTSGGPSPIPHATAGRTQCLGCHNNNASGVTQVPQSHRDAKLANEQCVNCHKSGAQSTSAPTAGPKPTAVPTTAAVTSGLLKLPANHVGRTVCAGCHAQGIGPRLPADHANRTDETCKACHANP